MSGFKRQRCEPLRPTGRKAGASASAYRSAAPVRSRTVGIYGWDGALGTSWANDPNEGLIGVVLTTDAFTSAFPPPAIVRDFWTGVYAALDT